MTKFQIGLTVVFTFFIIIGVAVFAFYKGGSGETKSNVVIWGTFSKTTFDTMYRELSISKNRSISVNYVEKNIDSFDNDFIDALASGDGPDLIIVPHDILFKHKNKIYPIPFQTFPERSYKDQFIEQAEMYFFEDGIYALPVSVDPLVMYWNRDRFSSNNIAEPPKYWDQFFDLTRTLSVIDPSLNVIHSAVALGEYSNVTNAKEIISALIMQAGNPITTWTNKRFMSVMTDRMGLPLSPTESAISFYVEFSNPEKRFYSWNRSLLDSQTRFISGDVSVYIGFASELNLISLKNPNLNFDVSLIPQVRDSIKSLTFGKIWGVSITKATINKPSAYTVANALSSYEASNILNKKRVLSSPRRDILSVRSDNPYLAIFNRSALISNAWFDLDRNKTEGIFREMIESITSGYSTLSSAIDRANMELQNLMK